MAEQKTATTFGPTVIKTDLEYNRAFDEIVELEGKNRQLTGRESARLRALERACDDFIKRQGSV
jgi:hypothetical protein